MRTDRRRMRKRTEKSSQPERRSVKKAFTRLRMAANLHREKKVNAPNVSNVRKLQIDVTMAPMKLCP